MYTLQRQRFNSEAEVHQYCLQVLRAKGIRALSEVSTGGLRTDIVIPGQAIIELKKELDRESIYQAYGQAQAYSTTLGIARIWIVGQCPIDPYKNAEAHSIASKIEANRTVKISFIEEDKFWQPGIGQWHGGYMVAQRLSVTLLGIGLLVCTLPYLSNCRISTSFSHPVQMTCKPLW